MEFKDLTPELKEKAKACKSTEELMTLAQSIGAELTDEQLFDIIVTNMKGVPMVFPLYLAVEGGPWWLLPYEPQVTIQGTNVLVKKQVAKGAVRGTIK